MKNKGQPAKKIEKGITRVGEEPRTYDMTLTIPSSQGYFER